jgi:L-threonylcarbamoyladenylate synthase
LIISGSPVSLRLRLAQQVLSAGGVIACPTEAVWGLSCDPRNRRAVERLLTLKGRSLYKGLILVAADEQQLEFLLADLEPDERRAMSECWPGPSTWLVPHRGRVSAWVHGAHETVAVRVSDHPVVAALCAAWGGPLVSTSANPAGCRPPQAGFQVRRYFGDLLDYIVPGAVGDSGRPTQIRDLASRRIIRS